MKASCSVKDKESVDAMVQRWSYFWAEEAGAQIFEKDCPEVILIS